MVSVQPVNYVSFRGVKINPVKYEGSNIPLQNKTSGVIGGLGWLLLFSGLLFGVSKGLTDLVHKAKEQNKQNSELIDKTAVSLNNGNTIKV